MKRIMLMKIKQTTINIIHKSQLTDFFACCSRRSDSSFSFSKFWSAILRECDSVCGAKRANGFKPRCGTSDHYFFQQRKGSSPLQKQIGTASKSPPSHQVIGRVFNILALNLWFSTCTCPTWLSCFITFCAARVLFLRLRAKLSISSANFSCMSWWCCNIASSSTADCFSSDTSPLQERKGKKLGFRLLWGLMSKGVPRLCTSDNKDRSAASFYLQHLTQMEAQLGFKGHWESSCWNTEHQNEEFWLTSASLGLTPQNLEKKEKERNLCFSML